MPVYPKHTVRHDRLPTCYAPHTLIPWCVDVYHIHGCLGSLSDMGLQTRSRCLDILVWCRVEIVKLAYVPLDELLYDITIWRPSDPEAGPPPGSRYRCGVLVDQFESKPVGGIIVRAWEAFAFRRAVFLMFLVSVIDAVQLIHCACRFRLLENRLCEGGMPKLHGIYDKSIRGGQVIAVA